MNRGLFRLKHRSPVSSPASLDQAIIAEAQRLAPRQKQHSVWPPILAAAATAMLVIIAAPPLFLPAELENAESAKTDTAASGQQTASIAVSQQIACDEAAFTAARPAPQQQPAQGQATVAATTLRARAAITEPVPEVRCQGAEGRGQRTED